MSSSPVTGMHLPFSTRIASLLLLLVCVAAEDKWSWGKDKDKAAESKHVSDDSASKDVVDDIIDSGRQGRNLQGYDAVYADPDVQNVLQGANDTNARHLIKDRLCDLGLGSVSFELHLSCYMKVFGKSRLDVKGCLNDHRMDGTPL